MYPLSTLHAVTDLSGKKALDVEVEDHESTTTTTKYFNFVVFEAGQLGSDLCYKDNIDDAFSMMRNAVRKLFLSTLSKGTSFKGIPDLPTWFLLIPILI